MDLRISNEHGNLRTYPDDEMRLAVSRAVAVETSRGWKISKEKASHSIDVVVALAMAALDLTEVAAPMPKEVTADSTMPVQVVPSP